MDIKILGSGSKGNCYRISDGKAALLLDAGLPIGEISRRLNFKLSEIDACLITHEHQDHAKAAKDLCKRGVPVYASQGTLEAAGIEGGGRIHNQAPLDAGTMQIMGFDLVHDAAEPMGFLITSHKTKDKLVYITDTQNCPYDFRRLTHIMLEINYDDETMARNVEEGTLDQGLAERIARNHMGLKEGVEFLKRHSGPDLKGVWILHMSDGNADEAEILRQAQRATGVPVKVC